MHWWHPIPIPGLYKYLNIFFPSVFDPVSASNSEMAKNQKEALLAYIVQ